MQQLVEGLPLRNAALGACSAVKAVHNQTSQFWFSFQGSVAMRDPSKIDALFPERRPETSQDKSPEKLDLENLAWPCCLLPGPGSERSPGALARGHVSTGVLRCGGRGCPGRTSCASLGGLSMSFREVPASCTDSHTLSFDTKVLALSSAPDVFKTHKRSVFPWMGSHVT